MTDLETQATEIGQAHGYNHANYVTAYGGELNTTPEVPLYLRTVKSFYLSAYEGGIADYLEEWEVDDPDLYIHTDR